MRGYQHDPSIAQIVRARIEAGLTYTEIGAELGMSRSAVAGIVYRTLRGKGVRSSETGRRKLPPKPVREPRPRARSVPKPPPEPKAPPQKRRPTTSVFSMRVVETASTSSTKTMKVDREYWDDELDDRLRSLSNRMSSFADIAAAMDRTVPAVVSRMFRLKLSLRSRLTETERDAVHRLYDEGVSIRRITVRVGVALNLVEKRVADIEAGLAVMVCRGAQKSATRKAPLVSDLKRRAG